jgi:hypothetical protein
MQIEGRDLMDDFHVDLSPDLEANVEKLPELITNAVEAADKIAAIAISSAPVVSGDYAAGISVEKTKRGARVFASTRDSAFVEFGVPSQGQSAHFTLRRAAEAAGFKFTKKGR